MTLSAARKGGLSDGTTEGLRNRMDDFSVTRRGKKAWRVVKGATRLLFKMSDHSGGDRD